MTRARFHRTHLPLLLSAGWLIAGAASAQNGWQCQRGEDGNWLCAGSTATTPAPESAVAYPVTDGAPAPAPAQPAPAAVAPAQTPAEAATGVAAIPPEDAAETAPPLAASQPTDDWVPIEQLSEAQRKRVLPFCTGAYIEPQPDNEEAALDPAKAPVRARARNSALRDNAIVEFSGDVQVQQGWRQVKAGRATLDRDKHIVELSEGVELREPGLAVRGDRATVRTQQNQSEIHRASYVLHDSNARGTAKEVERRGDRVYYDRATYTTCQPGSDAWQLYTRKLKTDAKSGFATARDATLRLGKVPVAYVPYIKFPIDDRRHTGLLWPSIGSGSDGLDYAQPVYINLAPNYDATLTPRYIADRGTMGEAEFRYMNSVSSWVFAGGYLGNDEQLEQDRWIAQVKESGYLGAGWSSSIDFTRVSDNDYLEDLQGYGLDTRRTTYLNQRGELAWAGMGFRFNARVHDYQKLEDVFSDPYQMLPQLELRYDQQQPFQLSPLLLTQYTQFENRDDRRVEGRRFYAEPGISYPMQWTWGYLTPTAKYRQVNYALDRRRNGLTDAPSAGTPLFKLDGGLYFDRSTQWGGKSYTQTLEPRLFYLYSDYQEQDDLPLFDTTTLTFSYDQLFRDTRFTGHDRLSDANQITLGVTSRLISDDNGVERLTGSIGQIFYFEDRRVINAPLGRTIRPDLLASNEDNSSEVAGELAYRISDAWRGTASLLWNPHSDLVNEGGVQARYHNADNNVFNIGYRFRRQQPVVADNGEIIVGDDIQRILTYRDISQADVSAIFPLVGNWYGLARFNYDLEEHRSLENLVGIEYNSCCWRARLVYQRGVDGDLTVNSDGSIEEDLEHAVILEVQLKGLGGLGGQVDRLLDESIIGYRKREDNGF